MTLLRLLGRLIAELVEAFVIVAGCICLAAVVVGVVEWLAEAP